LARIQSAKLLTSGELRKNAVVTCEVIGRQGWWSRSAARRHEDITSFIKRADLSP
jgi:small subunit ribosomal protein S1